MKKIYSFAFMLLLSTAIFGQTFLSEDFSSGQMPPPGWMTLPIGSQWTSSNTAYAGGSSPEARFEGFSYTGTVRMISPAVDLTGVDTVILLFKHFYDDDSGFGPTIGVATRAGSPWQSVWETTPSGNQGPEEVMVMITNENVGSPTFQLSFYLTGDMSGLDYWYLDDITLFNPPNLDCKMANIMTPGVITNPEEVTGVVKNLGHTQITEVSVSWQSYAGIVYDSTLTGLSLDLLDSFEFTFDGMWVSPFGSYDLKMWINNVNGIQDDDQNNDTLTKTIEYIAFITSQRPCFEEFTSSTCGPCAGFNTSFVPWCQTHQDIVLVKYQMNWPSPGDPYYTPEGGTRKNYYGVSYVPDLFCNGARVNTSIGAVQAAYNNASELTSTIDIASSFTITGTTINLTTNILPFQNFGNKKVFNIVFEKVTTGNVGNNGETEFHHVMMKMLPDANGASVNLLDREPVSLTYSFDLSGTHVEDYNDLMVAVIIQDYQSKEMLQTDYGLEDVTYSSEARLSSITLDGEPLAGFDPDIYEYNVVLPLGTVVEPVIEVETMDDGALAIITQAFQLPGTAAIDVFAENLFSTKRYLIHYTVFTGIDQESRPSVLIFPNPARDQLFITGLKEAKLAIYSVEGKLMLSQHKYSGSALDISRLPIGVYILRVMTDDGILIRKKVVIL